MFVSVIHHNACLEIFTDETFNISVLDYLMDVTHEFILGDVIEELLQIDIDNPYIAIVEVFECLDYSLLTTSFRSETIAEVTESRFEDRAQYLDYRLLNRSVNNGRNAELSYTTVRFRYFYPPSGRGL